MVAAADRSRRSNGGGHAGRRRRRHAAAAVAACGRSGAAAWRRRRSACGAAAAWRWRPRMQVRHGARRRLRSAADAAPGGSRPAAAPRRAPAAAPAAIARDRAASRPRARRSTAAVRAQTACSRSRTSAVEQRLERPIASSRRRTVRSSVSRCARIACTSSSGFARSSSAIRVSAGAECNRSRPSAIGSGQQRDAQPAMTSANRSGLIDGCPPGLWTKNNGCMPPGQAQKLLRRAARRGRRVHAAERAAAGLAYLYPDTQDYYYRYGDGYLYQVDRGTNLIAALLPLMAGGYCRASICRSSYMSSYVPGLLRVQQLLSGLWPVRSVTAMPTAWSTRSTATPAWSRTWSRSTRAAMAWGRCFRRPTITTTCRISIATHVLRHARL